MRLVIDTNLWISYAILPDSLIAALMRKLLSEGHELYGILQRSKFDAYIPLPERQAFFYKMHKIVEVIEPTQQIDACRDPKDNVLLELAVSGHADVILTGDRDLLVLHPFRRVQILTLSEFVK